MVVLCANSLKILKFLNLMRDSEKETMFLDLKLSLNLDSQELKFSLSELVRQKLISYRKGRYLNIYDYDYYSILPGGVKFLE